MYTFCVSRLLINVNSENVHRGSILGAILVARSGSSDSSKQQAGLYRKNELQEEIDALVHAVLSHKNTFLYIYLEQYWHHHD